MTANASELSARPDRDVVPAAPPPAEYRAPVGLPAPAPSPATFIPSVVPPAESARPGNSTTAPTNPSSDVAATASAGVAPSASPITSASPPSVVVRDERLAIVRR